MAEQCKCGSLDFFMEKQGNNTGLYCSMCGKWQKWMNKDETRVFEYNHKSKARNTIKQTNADRIRNMNDEELAEFLCKISMCKPDYCPAYYKCMRTEYGTMKEWLQSEVKGSDV